MNLLDGDNMNKGAFMSENMDRLEKDYPELFNSTVHLNDTVYSGKTLSQKQQKLIAIAIAASSANDTAIRKQMQNAIRHYDVTRDEIMDTLAVVLLMSGKPAFTKAVGILYSVLDE